MSAKESQPFDPYGILEIEPGASARDVKRAYRQLSLRFHPDKNPDPAASKYFAEFITKAYKALSDPIAKKNYEQHGHPDGPQVGAPGAGRQAAACHLLACENCCQLLASRHTRAHGLLPSTTDAARMRTSPGNTRAKQ